MKYLSRKEKIIYTLLFCVQVLFLIIFSVIKLSETKTGYTFRSMNALSDDLYQSEWISLKKGIYTVCVDYTSHADNSVIYAQSNYVGDGGLLSDEIAMSNGEHTAVFDTWVNYDTDGFCICIRGTDFTIQNMTVITSDSSARYDILKVFLMLALMDGILHILYIRKKGVFLPEGFLAALSLSLIASAGIFLNYVVVGHDLLFHLLRIEGIKDALLQGQFPVKIQPNWCNGYGYAVSVMYGDLFLYLPAVLRIMGLPIQGAYGIYILVINLMTAVFCWITFEEISHNKWITLTGTIVYLFAPYRFVNMYIRSAVGEYTAMAFFPLILLGLWYAIRAEEKLDRKKLLPLIIGMTGVLQSHIISCFMIAVVFGVFCLFEWKRIFRKNSLAYLIRGAFDTVLLNLWFLVPFLEYRREPLLVNEKMELTSTFQTWGLNLAQILGFYNSGSNVSAAWSKRLIDRSNAPIGLAIMASIVFAFCWLYQRKKGSLKRELMAALLSLLFAIALSTRYFPYYRLFRLSPKIFGIFANIRLPQRFIAIAAILGTFLLVLCAMELFEEKRRFAEYFLLAVSVLALMQGGETLYSSLYHGYGAEYYSETSLNTFGTMGNEYLYVGADTAVASNNTVPEASGAEITGWERKGTSFTISYHNAGEQAELLIPVFYYPGYHAYDMDQNGLELSLNRSEDFRVAVKLNGAESGTVRIQFQEPLRWRIAEGISLIMLVALICGSLVPWKTAIRNGNEKETEEESEEKAETVATHR